MLVVWVCGHLVDELRDLGGREGGEEVFQVDVGRRQHVAPEVHRARHLKAVSSAKAIQILQWKEVWKITNIRNIQGAVRYPSPKYATLVSGTF